MIYLDHNATTPPMQAAVNAMMPFLTEQWGNPSSGYRFGANSRKAIEAARGSVARLVGAEPTQVIFTSGATEANNAALHAAAIADSTKRHIVTSAVEHSAVLGYCEYLECQHEFEVTRLPVDVEGWLDPKIVRGAIRPDTAIVSLMWANNETGVLWPINEFAKICVEKEVLFHTDAVQAVGKVPIDFGDLGVSYLSLSGHKFGAPKGIGALLVQEPDRFEPFIYGGRQENGLRGGTECVPLIIALGKAAELRSAIGVQRWEQVHALRDSFENEVLSRVEGVVVNGEVAGRLPNTSNLHIPGVDADAAFTYLDRKGICVSSGSACLESAIAPSHVIMAMTSSHERASESLRISVGLETSEEEMEYAARALIEFAEIARSPVGMGKAN